MAGDEGAFELREDGAAEPVHAGPRVPPGCDHGQKVVAQLLAQVLLHVPGRAQLADGTDRWGFAHLFTLTALTERR